MDEQQKDRVEQLRRQLQERIAGDVVMLVKTTLKQKNPCSHLEHRLQPNRYDDWQAIDNMMYIVTDLLGDALPAFALRAQLFAMQIAEHGTDEETFKKYVASGDCVGHKAMESECILKACLHILNFHHSIVSQYGRGNNADMHYDRIINSTIDMYAVVGKAIHDHGMDGMVKHARKECDELVKKAQASHRPDKGKMH